MRIYLSHITRIAVVAALYVALTLMLSPISYGIVQFRFSELLMLLCFFRWDYCLALTIGCAIANLFSPMMALDLVFGTSATLIAAVCMLRCQKLWTAAVLPAVTNGILVGFELVLAFSYPPALAVSSVFAGELAVMLPGIPLIAFLQKKYPSFCRIIGITKKENTSAAFRFRKGKGST